MNAEKGKTAFELAFEKAHEEAKKNNPPNKFSFKDVDSDGNELTENGIWPDDSERIIRMQEAIRRGVSEKLRAWDGENKLSEKELRDLLGDSITPTMDKWLHNRHKKGPNKGEPFSKQEMLEFIKADAELIREHAEETATFWRELQRKTIAPTVIPASEKTHQSRSEIARDIKTKILDQTKKMDVVVNDVGKTVNVDQKTIDKTFSYGAKYGIPIEVTRDILLQTKNLLRNAVYIGSRPDYANDGSVVHYFLNGVTRNDGNRRVVFMTHDQGAENGSNHLYVEEVELIDKTNTGANDTPQPRISANLLPFTSNHPGVFTIPQLLANYNTEFLRFYPLKAEKLSLKDVDASNEEMARVLQENQDLKKLVGQLHARIKEESAKLVQPDMVRKMARDMIETHCASFYTKRRNSNIKEEGSVKVFKRSLLAFVLALAMVMTSSLSALAVSPFEKTDPAIEVSVIQSVTVGADQEDRSENNEFLKFIEENYGIRITHKWVTTPEQYDQKVALMLATDDLADIMVVDMKTMGQMIDAGQAADLTDVWAEYADDLTRSLMDPAGSTGFGMATRDGRLYGIPLTTPVLETLHGLFLREDWRQKLNLPEPTTLADLEKILYAFAKDDPDGNGVDDTYGIGLNKDLYGDGYELTSIANAMHAYPNAWVKGEDGKIVYGSVQPEMRQALETLAKWNKDGLIDPEFTVKNHDKEAELVLKEKLVAFFGVQWAQFMSNAVVDLWVNNTDSDWKLWQIPSVDENPAKPIVYDNARQFVVVSSKSEHPEAAVRILDIMHKLGAGSCADVLPTVEDFNKVWNDWGWMPLRPESIHGNVVKWENVFAALDKRDVSLVEYNYNALDLYNKLVEYYDHPEYRKSENQDERDLAKGKWGNLFSGQMFAMASKLNEENLLTYEQCGAIVTDTMVESLAQLEKMELEAFTRIITGDATIDEFDNFVQNWNKMGGEQITEEINAYYAQ